MCSLIAELNQLKQEFYEEKGKNSLFKKKQKEECARRISSKYRIEELAQATIFNVPDTNRVFIDYTIFKLFVNTNNIGYVVNYIIFNIKETIRKYGNFIVDFNLDTFTVSAAERYKDAILLYSEQCNNNENKNTDFVMSMVCMNIYNTPSVIDMIKLILKPLTDPTVYSKIKSYSKEETEAIFAESPFVRSSTY